MAKTPDYYNINLQCGLCGLDKPMKLCLHTPRLYVMVGCKACQVAERVDLPGSVGVHSTISRQPLTISIKKIY